MNILTDNMSNRVDIQIYDCSTGFDFISTRLRRQVARFIMLWGVFYLIKVIALGW